MRLGHRRATAIFCLAHQIGISIILSHIPIPARGKDKKRTAARWPHAGRTSFRDVIIMLK